MNLLTAAAIYLLAGVAFVVITTAIECKEQKYFRTWEIAMMGLVTLLWPIFAFGYAWEKIETAMIPNPFYKPEPEPQPNQEK